MAIYIGTSKVKGIYIGTSKVKEIYAGTSKVYQSKINLITAGTRNTAYTWTEERYTYDGSATVSYNSGNIGLNAFCYTWYQDSYAAVKCSGLSCAGKTQIVLDSQSFPPDSSSNNGLYVIAYNGGSQIASWKISGTASRAERTFDISSIAANITAITVRAYEYNGSRQQKEEISANLFNLYIE